MTSYTVQCLGSMTHCCFVIFGQKIFR